MVAFRRRTWRTIRSRLNPATNKNLSPQGTRRNTGKPEEEYRVASDSVSIVLLLLLFCSLFSFFSLCLCVSVVGFVVEFPGRKIWPTFNFWVLRVRLLGRNISSTLAIRRARADFRFSSTADCFRGRDRRIAPVALAPLEPSADP